MQAMEVKTENSERRTVKKRHESIQLKQREKCSRKFDEFKYLVDKKTQKKREKQNGALEQL